MCEPTPGPSSRSDEVSSDVLSEPFHQFEKDKPHVKRGKYVSEILKMWNLTRLNKNLGTLEKCIMFTEEKGLVAKQKLCSNHHCPMRVKRTTNKTFGSWVCYKKTCKNKNKEARTKDTFFENIKIDLKHVYYLIYAYSHNWSYATTILEDPYKDDNNKCLSKVTVSDWFNFCREVVVIYQLKKQQYVGKLGGPDKIVQIDESKFGKRIHKKGHHIEGKWVLGFIENGSEDLRLEVCPNNIRSAGVLIPLILKHVEIGTTIHTNNWEVYDCLSEHGFIHNKANHSVTEYPFIAPDGAHTQRIMSQWRVVKNFFRDKHISNDENFANIVVEYMWRRSVTKYDKDPFEEILKCIQYAYIV